MAYSFPLAKNALSRISTNLAQLQTVIQQLQQREQVNHHATQRKNQQESNNVQLIQQLNQLIRSCQMEIGQFSQSGFPTSAKARAQVPYQVPVSVASSWNQPMMTTQQPMAHFQQHTAHQPMSHFQQHTAPHTAHHTGPHTAHHTGPHTAPHTAQQVTLTAVEQVKKAMALMEQASFFARRAYSELGFVAPQQAQQPGHTWSRYPLATNPTLAIPPQHQQHTPAFAIPPQHQQHTPAFAIPPQHQQHIPAFAIPPQHQPTQAQPRILQ